MARILGLLRHVGRRVAAAAAGRGRGRLVAARAAHHAAGAGLGRRAGVHGRLADPAVIGRLRSTPVSTVAAAVGRRRLGWPVTVAAAIPMSHVAQRNGRHGKNAPADAN